MPDTPVRVALVSAPELVRAGLHSLLVPLEARVVLLTTVPPTPDVALFTPATTSLRDLGVLPSGCPAIALTWDEDRTSAHRARELGAVRSVSIAAPIETVVQTIEQVAVSGPVPAGPPALPALEPAIQAGLTPGSLPLTGRERDVLARICLGMSNQEIADELYLSINSVKTYVRSSYRKIGATRRSHAVLWGLQQG